MLLQGEGIMPTHLTAVEISLVRLPANKRRLLLVKGADYQDDDELARLLNDGMLSEEQEREARQLLKAHGVTAAPAVVEPVTMETPMDHTNADRLARVLKSALGATAIQNAASNGRGTFGDTADAALEDMTLGELRNDPLLPVSLARARVVKSARGGALLGMTLSPLAGMPLDRAIETAAHAHADYATALASALGANLAKAARQPVNPSGVDAGEEFDGNDSVNAMKDLADAAAHIKGQHPDWSTARCRGAALKASPELYRRLQGTK
jgi:hypothetical protein